MSLDVSLCKEVWISYDRGKTHEITHEEQFSLNITHNLGEMARECGLYSPLWRPYQLIEGYEENSDYNLEWEFENSQTIYAKDIIEPIKKGLLELTSKPDYYKTFNPSNNWGSYESLVNFTTKYLEACKENPDLIVKVDR